MIASASLGLDPAPARADNIWLWVVDSDYRVSMSAWALTTTVHTSFHDTYTNNVAPTDIAPSHAHDVTTEITAYDAYYGATGWVGLAVCLQYDPAEEDCNGGVQVKVNLSYGPYPQLESDSIMCEEVGHAVGLDHDFQHTGTCMSQNPANRRWNSHDVGLINGWF